MYDFSQLPAELRIDAGGMRAICTSVFEANGMCRENAEIVADNLVRADLRGVSSHGSARLKSYVERFRRENWRLNPVMEARQTGAVTLLDGNDGFGSVVGAAAMRYALRSAADYGVGICAAHRSSHFGMASYYPLLAVEQDMIGFCCTNGMPNLAHFGSREALLGTNPFSMAVPVADRPPLVLDVACSVTARGNISNAKREGRTIPAGWAIDRDGNATTDPTAALAGCVLPFGGHKGSGIAIMVDAMCGVLSGASYGKHLRRTPEETQAGVGPNVGHFFLAINIAAFDDKAAFKLRMKAMVEELKLARPMPGVAEIFVPGEIEARMEAANLLQGIKVGRGAFQEICETCGALGLSIDPFQSIL